MSKIKLLALDLDGTLLGPDSRVSRENARAVRLAQQKGVQIVLCTGRNLTETRAFNEQLDAPADWAVIANGAAVQRFADGAQIAFDGLDREMCAAVRKLCAQFRDLVVHLEAQEGEMFIPGMFSWSKTLLFGSCVVMQHIHASIPTKHIL